MSEVSKLGRGKGILAVLLLGAVVIVGCTDAGTDADGDGLASLSGDVAIDGSSTVYPLSEAVAKRFEEQFPNVRVTVSESGTGGGFKRFGNGETDISNASRPIKPSELEKCQESKVAFIELPVAFDGLTIAVHKENDWVESLNVEHLKQIFLEGGAATWKEVNENWPDEPIKIYAPGADSGTFDYFKEVVGDENASFKGASDNVSTSEDDNSLVTGIAGEKYAIGFFGASYYYGSRDKLKAVAIVNPESGEAVLPEPAEIESGNYAPFSRPLFVYVKVASLDRPEVKKYVEFMLDSAAELAGQTGYVALPAEVYAAAREHYQNRWAGTHYLTEGGEKREGSVVTLYRQENLFPAPAAPAE